MHTDPRHQRTSLFRRSSRAQVSRTERRSALASARDSHSIPAAGAAACGTGAHSKELGCISPITYQSGFTWPVACRHADHLVMYLGLDTAGDQVARTERPAARAP